jgi:hypothetical protein
MASGTRARATVIPERISFFDEAARFANRSNIDFFVVPDSLGIEDCVPENTRLMRKEKGA